MRALSSEADCEAGNDASLAMTRHAIYGRGRESRPKQQ